MADNLVPTLYTDNDQREQCYTCSSSGTGNVEVMGKPRKLECRMYTKIGNALETRLSAKQADIFEMNLIDIVEVGVDSAEITFNNSFKFTASSRGGGGVSKYECKDDYQVVQLIRHKKVGYTELIYVHHKNCPKEFISTELQGMIYEMDEYSESYNVDNALSDAYLLAARNAVSRQVQHTDVIGIFGGANELADSYDGILAQAYWAYTSYAYFHSVKFDIDENALIDGTYVHAKYAGLQIDILFDSTLPTDATVNRYATKSEVYEAIVDWLNDDVRTESNRKYVDATYFGSAIIVTSKFAETTVNLEIFLDMQPTVKSWADCKSYDGVTREVLQGAMPIDERPILVKFQRYTIQNILKELPNDIYLATRDFDKSLVVAGQRMALYIDSYVWGMYKQALKTRPQDATSYSLEDDYTIYQPDALSVSGGTGLWFVTVESANSTLRNIAHLVDTISRIGAETIQIRLTDDCRKMKLFYETLHGVLVKDFRLFASNLLCSPFANLLKEPYENTIPNLPCYNRQVRDNFINPSSCEDNCKLRAGFVKVDEYKNGALYGLSDGQGGFTIHVLEAGDIKPNNALPVYEIKFEDRTLGIPVTQIANVVYNYEFETSDGVQWVSTDKDPVVRYVSQAAGITFNVTQTVSIPDLNCESTFIASDFFGEDYPFELRGECADIDLKLEGTVERSSVYSLGAGIDYAQGTVVNVNGVEEIIPTLSGPEENAIVINDWFLSNGYAGEATGDNIANTLVIFSPQVIFVRTQGDLDPFVNEKLLTIIDTTIFDEGDGIANLELFSYCQGSAQPGSPQFTELPNQEGILDCSGVAGWVFDANIVTKLGCTFNGLTVNVPNLANDEYFVNFELTI